MTRLDPPASARTAMWFASVPVGMKIARSLPSARAQSSSSASTTPPSEYESGVIACSSSSCASRVAYCVGLRASPSPLSRTVRSSALATALDGSANVRPGIAAVTAAPMPPNRSSVRRVTVVIEVVLPPVKASRHTSWRFRQRNRRLAERILPAGRRADVRIAEPQLVVDRRAGARAFDPQQRRHDSRIFPYPNRLRAGIFFLVLVNRRLVARILQQVRLLERLAAAGDQDEIVSQDAIHRRGVVRLHRGLILSIERRDDALRVIGGRCAGDSAGDGHERRRSESSQDPHVVNCKGSDTL